MTRVFTFVTALLFTAFAFAQVAPVDRAPAIPPAQSVLAHNGMVVAQESRAARIGVEILDRGGNAVDAAVATGFALAVTYPRAGNIGGGGFMLIHLAKGNRDVAIDYRETAPAAATATMFLDAQGNPDPQKSRNSALAVGVPGTVAGLALALEKYGSGNFTLADLIAPAIELAQEGFAVEDDLAEFAARRAPAFGTLAVIGVDLSRWRRRAARRRPADPVRSRRHAARQSRRTARAPFTRAAPPKRSPPRCAPPAAS